MPTDHHMAMNDVLIRMFRSVDANDWASLKVFYCEDCRYERPGFPAINGLQELLYFYENVRPIRQGAHTLDCVVVEGGTVTASGSFVGTLRTGAALNLQFMDRYHFRDGRIDRRKTFFFTPLA